MIARIYGQIIEILSDHLIIDVNGVGFDVAVPKNICAEHHIGQYISLNTYLVVREDLLSLYGFTTAEEREFFHLLLGVEGIGPKIALATLSSLSVDAIKRAVLSEQSEMFNMVPGIGKKTAQKILIHFQGKVKSTYDLEAVSNLNEIDSQVLDALVSLGYSVIEGQKAIQSLPKIDPLDVEERLRGALQYLSK